MLRLLQTSAVVYDDDEEEWLHLPSERHKLLAGAQGARGRKANVLMSDGSDEEMVDDDSDYAGKGRGTMAQLGNMGRPPEK